MDLLVPDYLKYGDRKNLAHDLPITPLFYLGKTPNDL
jgi:hypothetical protein